MRLQNHRRNFGWRAFMMAGLLIATLPVTLRAQSFAMAPAEIDETFKPGQPFTFRISVSNDGNQSAALRVTVTDFWYNEKNQKTFGTAGTSPRSAANWMEAVPAVVSLPPNGTQQLRIMVTPPANASGGYYATVFVESTPELVKSPDGGGRGVFANFRLGALVLLAAENTQKYSAEITDIKVTPPVGNTNLQVDFTFNNTGNTHVFPRPTLTIVNQARKLVGKAEGDPERSLPGQKSPMSFTWPGKLDPGHYEGLLTVVYGKGKIFTQTVPIDVDK
jgi:P pilus assembly chaperone PapD